MKPVKFNIQDLIDSIEGTCNSIDSTVQSMYDDGDDFDWMGDLTPEELETLDSQIFQCQQCGWWNEQPAEENEYEEWICYDCADHDGDED